MRLTRTILASSIAGALMAGTAAAQTKVDMIGFGGASNLPIWLAMDKGLFAKHGLEVKLDRTRGSEAQIKDMMAGKYQIASTSIDNIIGYTEGQGPIKIDNFDMVAFMGVHSGLNSVVTRPEIKTYADIKGKPVAVDAPNTGYAFVLFRILENNGLKYKQDYTVLAVGGGPDRLAAMKEGKAVAAVLSAPNDVDAKEAGFNILADAAAELGGYQGSAYGVRRGWAKANEKTMISFIQAIVEAHNHIFTNKDEAIAVLKARVKGLDDKEANTVYTSLTSGKGGLNRKAEINLAGVKTVLSLRGQYAEPKKTLTDPAKYIDMSYYEKATKGMK
jgi:ABC-type nitrate/sulfonate/bicarbonate transport system substrate-binding protein